MVVLIDNYDSFTYNLFHLITKINPDCRVFRNDAIKISEIKELKPDCIVLSPGPGRPKDAGICETLIKEMSGDFPILGVCLGHQAICESFGAKITYAGELMHGKASEIYFEEESILFKGLNNPFKAARYHSLAVDENSLPNNLKVTARTIDGEVMAVEDKERRLFGLQFHPESVLTTDGEKIMKNFFEVV